MLLTKLNYGSTWSNKFNNDHTLCNIVTYFHGGSIIKNFN